MIYPEVNLEAWLKKTGLVTGIFDCPRCLMSYPVNIPCVEKDYWGLQSRIHHCGPKFIGFVIAARSQEKKTFWAKIRQGIKPVERR